MIELHERLSEFSYGYGITREIERLLDGIGIKTAPFLPSLLQEAQLGFDVGFKKPGAAILVQFKLGQSVRRFVRPKSMTSAPSIAKPFWRFKVNTAEAEGQYETLLKAEQDGAEAYYAAPRFVDWNEYLALFETEKVLENSLLIRPTEIRDKLVAQRLPDGLHRIVYDGAKVFVCSEPVRAQEIQPEQFATQIREKVHRRETTLDDLVRRLFLGMDHRHYVRRVQPRESLEDKDADAAYRYEIDSNAAQLRRTARQQRLRELQTRARSETDAVAAAIGTEMWSLGIQLIFAEEKQP
jgi:hypothetical protein